MKREADPDPDSGEARRRGIEYRTINARSALNPTGGFLAGAGGTEPGYTHSFNPAIGCAFARGLCGAYCYARGFAERLGGAGIWKNFVLVKENAPELVQAELERAARRAPDHPHHVTRLRIFSPSTTEPCAGPVLAVYRDVLRVVAAFPIARWVVQTRSPAVLELEPELRALGERVVVSFTVESDDDALTGEAPPGAPSIRARRRAFERLAAIGVRRHLAAAPLLPLAAPIAFADWIAAFATDATVDTMQSGDGAAGRRTASSEWPAFALRQGLDWRSEDAARAFLALLQARMGARARWSAAGFAALAR